LGFLGKDNSHNLVIFEIEKVRYYTQLIKVLGSEGMILFTVSLFSGGGGDF
jgi:hypothetical protein